MGATDQQAGRPAVIAVATVKDTLSNLERFVSRNLANGIDHLVVFTEDADEAATAFLDRHDSVTHVPTADDWWPERPDELNVRQRLNANLARVLLAPFDWAAWLVHIDGDEVAVVDHEVLAGFAPRRRAFRLPPLEAVSRESWPTGEVTHFKRLLARPELLVLTAMGLIEEPNNRHYFHGHVRGKVGVRLRTDLRLGLHAVTDARGRCVRAEPASGLSLLHYDATDAEEFVRKFTAMAGSGPPAAYRSDRSPTVNAVRTLGALDVPDEVRTRCLHRIFERTTLEDFTTLHELGLLEETHADAGTHRPWSPPQADLAAFADLLAAAAPLPRHSLRRGHPRGGYDVLQAALLAAGLPAGPTAAILDRVASRPSAESPPPERQVRWTPWRRATR